MPTDLKGLEIIAQASMVCHQAGYHDLGKGLDEIVAPALEAYEAAKPKEAERLKLFGLKVVIDDTMPPDVVEVRSHNSRGEVVERVRAMLSAAGDTDEPR